MTETSLPLDVMDCFTRSGIACSVTQAMPPSPERSGKSMILGKNMSPKSVLQMAWAILTGPQES